MVLENVSEEGSFSNDGAPASDGDPYGDSSFKNANDQSGELALNIDTTNFPKPIPIIGSLIGYNSDFYAKVLRTRLFGTMQILGRPLSADEANALGYWTAKQVSIVSYGGPIGVLGAVYRARVTSDRFRFPFYQPNLEKFSKDYFPSTKLAWVRGARATFLWHLWRYAAYGAFGNFFGKVLLGSYSMSVCAVGELGDPRLKDMVKVIREKAQNARGKLPNQPRQPGMVDGVQQKDASTLWKDHRQEIGDDASPTSGAYVDANEVAENKQPHQSSTPYATMPKVPQWPSRSKQKQEEPNPEAPFFGDGGDDDASPTGGRGMMEESGTRQGGSAWDRVRRQADTNSPESKTSAWPQTQKAGQSTDQRTWSQIRGNRAQDQQDGTSAYDQSGERQAVKDAAQKEFDARVEQERRGGDFSSGGDQKRW